MNATQKSIWTMWLRTRQYEELVAYKAELEAVKDARDAAVTALRQELDEARRENATLRLRLQNIAAMCGRDD